MMRIHGIGVRRHIARGCSIVVPKRRLVSLTLAVGILMVGMSIPSTPASAQTLEVLQTSLSESNLNGTYTDIEAFEQAVEQARSLRKALKIPQLTDSERKQRVQELDRALSEAGTDRTVRDQITKELGLITYRSGEQRSYAITNDGTPIEVGTTGEVGIMTSSQQDVTIYRPELTYDPVSDAVGVSASVEWIDDVSLDTDLMYGGPGGNEAFTIIIEGISDRDQLIYQTLRTYYMDDRLGEYGHGLSDTELKNGVWPITMEWEDRGLSARTYNSWRNEMTVWLEISTSFSATAAYAHDWDVTRFKEVGFNLQVPIGGKRASSPFGVQWTWEQGTDAWRVLSNTVTWD